MTWRHATGASDEDEAVSKSLFTLPFMKRAQERRKLAAQKQAQRLLEELEGRAAEPDEGGMSGRRNFGLATGVQVRTSTYNRPGACFGPLSAWHPSQKVLTARASSE